MKDVCESFIKKDQERTACKTPLSAFCTQAEKNSFGDFWGTSQGASQVAIFNNSINIEKQIDFFKTLILQDELRDYHFPDYHIPDKFDRFPAEKLSNSRFSLLACLKIF